MIDEELSRLIDRDLTITERKAMTAVKRMIAQWRQSVLVHAKAGMTIPDMQSKTLREITPLLRDAMIVADLRGRARSAVTLKRKLPGRETGFLRLSVFDSVLDALGRVTGASVKKLREKYQTEAFNLMRGVARNQQSKVQQLFNEQIEKGAHVNDAVKAIRSQWKQTARESEIETVFRTQTQIAYGAGRWQADQDPAVQEILWGYEYVTVGDDRVRPEHAELEGTILPKDDPFWRKFWPPNGWNCRCQVIPIFDPEPINTPPPDAEPDDGFAFNPGMVLMG